MSVRRFSCLFLILILAACNRPDRSSPVQGQPAPATATGKLEGTLTSGGDQRHYRLYVPTTYQPGTPLPLVINFHGFGSNSTQEETLSGMSRKAEQAGFLVVYPSIVNGPTGRARAGMPIGSSCAI